MGINIHLSKNKSISYLKLPFDFFENNFQKLSAVTLKVYMYILYLCTLGNVELNNEELSKKLNVSKSDVSDAYNEMLENGLISINEETGVAELISLDDYYKNFHKENYNEKKKEAEKKEKKLTPSFMKKMRFMEDLYGKEFTQNDLFEIDDLLNNQKVPYEVLVCAIEYSCQKNIKSLNYISKIAINWKELGLNSYESCENYIAEEKLEDEKIYKKIKQIMKISRELYDVEKKYIYDWYYVHKKTIEDIKKAVDTTVINTGKIAFPYINSILLNEGKNKSVKSPVNKNNINNFSERDYNFEDVMSAIRKKQNG